MIARGLSASILLSLSVSLLALAPHASAALLDASFGAAATAGSAGDTAEGAYWVFFRDKAIQSDEQYRQALAGVVASYSPAAIERRQTRSITATPFGYDDLPVADAYSSAVLSSGASLRVTSSWLNAVSVSANAGQLAAISALPFVGHVQPVARFGSPAIDVSVTVDVTAAEAQTFYGSAQNQLAQIHVPEVHNLGITGAGVTIGILDTGFKRTHQAFNEPGHPLTVLGERDFVDGTPNVTSETTDNQHVHGTYILGTLGGYKPNTYVGVAYNASFLLAKTEVVPTETQIEEDHWVDGLQWLELNGADLVTSSLGYVDWYTQSQLNGVTAVTTIAANVATSAGLPIINAAGNENHDFNPATSSLIAPADAQMVITVGAVDVNGNLASFSSSGRNTLPWIKPEVLAMGVGTSTVNPNNNAAYQGVNGTSLSTPLVAGTVALMLEANPNLTVPQIRQLLFSTASRANNPDTTFYNEGYGIINALAAVEGAESLAAQAVPEPSAIILAAVGLVGLACVRLIRARLS